MTYRTATVVLSVLLAMTYIAVVIVVVTVLLPQLKLAQSMNRAVQHAADNDTLCSLVPCDFRADTAVQPPPDAEVTAATGKYDLASSRFAAQAVAVLEDAVLNKLPLTPLPQTDVLATFSGNPDQPDKLQNMAWLLKPRGTSNQVWLAFRGTQTKGEWQIDWDMTQVPWNDATPGALVHRGFRNAAQELMPAITAALQSVIKAAPDTHIFVTGHSLGASLATLCVLHLLAAGLANLHAYIYAPPRTGNDSFVRLVLAQPPPKLREFHAIANVADIIPQVPLSVMPNVKDAQQPMLYEQFPLLMFQDNWGSWVHNHVMPVYIANLDKVAPVSTSLKGAAKPFALPFKPPSRQRVPPGFTHSLAKKILFTP